MSRARPHYFPDDTPDPVAESWDSIGELLQLIKAWLWVAGGCGLAAALLALFFPSVFNLFR